MAKLSQPPTLSQRWSAKLDDHTIALAWSTDGSQLAAASVSGPITVFDVATGTVAHTLSGHGFGTTAIAWQPGGKRLASAGQDGKARLWEAGREVVALDAGAAWVERLAWHPKGTSLVTAAGRKLKLWSGDGELQRSYPDQSATIAAVQWSSKGREFVSAGYGGVTFWRPDAEASVNQFEWKGSIVALAWSPDLKYIAGGAQDSSVHFWTTKTGKDLEMTGYPQKVAQLAWDASSSYLATGGSDVITTWNCTGKGPAGSAPLTLGDHAGAISSLAFQNRGPLLASGCDEGILNLTLPGGSRKTLGKADLSEGISVLSWAPADGRLAVGGAEGSVSVWTV